VSPKRSIIRIVSLTAVLPALCICVASCQVALPLALTGTSMGVAYYYMNTAEKTCVYDFDTMTKASVSTLKRMGFTVGEQSTDNDGDHKIEANAENLDVTIKLKHITDKCTKIKVTASEDVVIRDKATAFEIIYQTEQAAERIARRSRRARR
jgi:hypothetical protein